MLILKQLLFSILVISLLSCKNESRYPYAIKDFRQSLQPHLFKVVSKGIVMYYDSSLRNMATDKELIQLSRSEHPVLRASAFREIFKRKSFDHFDILMDHLDDTAVVATDAGEFGIWYRTVSDDILQEAGWKTQESKDKTIEEVLTKHNYLRSAYLILLRIEPKEKYYSFVKDMATRPRLLSDEGYELNFADIEYALYGLAKFKKKEDVIVIKGQLLKNIEELSEMSFSLMKEFPDTAYLDILRTYHRRRFYRFSGDNKHGFTGNDDNRASSKDFIGALVAQQSAKSAQIIDTILNYFPSITCIPDKEFIENELIMEVWEHPSPAYTKIRDRIKIKAEEISKSQFSIPLERNNIPIDTTDFRIRWFP